MFESVERWIEHLLRVPPDPEAPFGAGNSVQVFRAARGFFYHRLLGWALRQVILLLSIGIGLLSYRFTASESVPGGQTFWLFELITVSLLILQIPMSFLTIALDFRYRWYIVTDRSLRIREGVWRVQERTMTFSNIQNLSIRQGPVQRLFGIADLEVRTAGGGDSMAGQKPAAATDNLHIGYFRGVANPEEIRDIILRRLRTLRASGLGDPDDPAAYEGPGGEIEAPTGQIATEPMAAEPMAAEPMAAEPITTNATGSPVLTAARELLEEVRRLRREARGEESPG